MESHQGIKYCNSSVAAYLTNFLMSDIEQSSANTGLPALCCLDRKMLASPVRQKVCCQKYLPHPNLLAKPELVKVKGKDFWMYTIHLEAIYCIQYVSIPIYTYLDSLFTQCRSTDKYRSPILPVQKHSLKISQKS